jgi:hypothetical protein
MVVAPGRTAPMFTNIDGKTIGHARESLRRSGVASGKMRGIRHAEEE